MKAVRENKVYCPMYKDVRLLPCPDPPGKTAILREVLKASDLKKLDLGITNEGHIPNKEWLLVVLSTLEPDHLFFKKDYLPPAKNEALSRAKESKVVNNADSFFTSLPSLHKKKDLKGRSGIREYRT